MLWESWLRHEVRAQPHRRRAGQRQLQLQLGLSVYTVGTGGGYGGFYCFALTP